MDTMVLISVDDVKNSYLINGSESKDKTKAPRVPNRTTLGGPRSPM